MITPVDYYSKKLEHRYKRLQEMFELTGYTESVYPSDIKIGSSFLGNGAFASVRSLLGDSSVVIKECSSRDDYLDYVDWCVERQDCKYVPKIYKRLKVGDTTHIFMKRYEHDDNQITDDVKSTVGQTGYYGEGDFNFERLRKHGEDFMEFVKELCEDFKDYNFDLHSGNVMFDGGVPVITDPITTKKRIVNSTVDIKIDCGKLKLPSLRWNLDVFREHVKNDEPPKFKFKSLQIPKFRQPNMDKPIWLRDNKWA